MVNLFSYIFLVMSETCSYLRECMPCVKNPTEAHTKIDNKPSCWESSEFVAVI